MDFSNVKILGIDANIIFILILVMLFVIFGIVTFQMYGFISSGQNSVFSAGTGFGVSILPDRQQKQKIIVSLLLL